MTTVRIPEGRARVLRKLWACDLVKLETDAEDGGGDWPSCWPVVVDMEQLTGEGGGEEVLPGREADRVLRAVSPGQ